MLPQIHSVPAQSHAGCAEAIVSPPRPALRPYTAGYAGFRSTAAGYVRRRVLPLNLATVIVDFGGAGGRLTGPRGTPEVYEQADWRHGVAIGLTPAGVAALFGTPMRELVGASLTLEELLGRRAVELAERLRHAPDWAARFTVLDDRLAAWLRPDRRIDEVTLKGWRRLQTSPAPIRIGALAEALGVSRRRLELGFAREIGLTPKTVARIARFQQAVYALSRPAARLASAAECGYADQPHLNREFRALAGVTPTELFAFLQDIDERPGYRSTA